MRWLALHVCCCLASTACELSVYSPLVAVVRDGDSSGTGDGSTGDSRTGDSTGGDPGAGDPGKLIDGSSCTDGNQCQSDICIDDVCCSEACDQVCERCDGAGDCVPDTDDDDCGDIDCDLLDSTCRDYHDPSARCASRGVCKVSNSSDCTDYDNLSVETDCDDGEPGTAPDKCDGDGGCAGNPIVLAKVGSFNIGTDPIGTTVTIDGFGFRPKVVFFWWSGRTSDTTTVTTSNGRQHYRRGIGFATGPGNERLVTNQAENNSSPSADTDRMIREDGCISSLTTGRSVDGLAELRSFDDDGFSVDVVFDAFDANLAISYLALGGEAITNAAVGTFTSAASTGVTSQDVTGVGFQPDVVFFLSGLVNDTNPSTLYSTSSGAISFGAATGGALEENATIAAAAPNGSSPPWGGAYALLGESVVTGSTWMSLYERGKVAAMLPDGFQIEWIELDENDAYYYFYLALQGGNPYIGTMLSGRSSDPDPIVVTGVGYRPETALLLSRGDGENTPDNGGGRDQLSMGAFTAPTEQWVQATLHYRVDGDPQPSAASAALSSENVYFRLSDGGGRSASMELVSVESDGFTTHMTDWDSSQRFIWFVTFGPGPPP